MESQSIEATLDSRAGSDKQDWRKALIKRVLTVVFAIALLWLAFRGCNFVEIWNYTRQTDPLFLFLLFVCGIISQVLRAWRWIFMLEPVAGRKISLWNSYCAVVVGYAVNVVVPRGGEVARLVSITRSEKLSWAGVLSTLLLDRLLDIALLVFALGLTLTVLPKNILDEFPWLVPGGVMLLVATIIGLVLLPKMGAILRWVLRSSFAARSLPEKIISKLSELSAQFDVGTKCLTNPVAYPAIVGLSVAIWVFFAVSYYLMVLAFHLNSQISAAQCLVIFSVGSTGVLVPTPGSIGSFHFLVSQTMMLTAGVDKDLALAYATALHVFSFIVVACIPAAVCLPLQSALSDKKASQPPVQARD